MQSRTRKHIKYKTIKTETQFSFESDDLITRNKTAVPVSDVWKRGM